MSNNIEIVIPEELAEMEVLSTIISPTLENTGVLIMGENLQSQQVDELPVIRVYLLEREGEEFHIEMELEAFAFLNVKSALSFVETLPNMSALELMVLMNKQAPFVIVGDSLQ